MVGLRYYHMYISQHLISGSRFPQHRTLNISHQFGVNYISFQRKLWLSVSTNDRSHEGAPPPLRCRGRTESKLTRKKVVTSQRHRRLDTVLQLPDTVTTQTRRGPAGFPVPVQCTLPIAWPPFQILKFLDLALYQL